MKMLMKFAASACVTAALVACGGGSNPTIDPVATTNVTAPLNAATGAQLIQALTNTPLTFAGGVPALGTTADTTLAINAGGFNIASGGSTATGQISFGSCIFTVGMDSTFPANHPLGPGKTVTVNPCEIEAQTAGATANGSTQQIGLSLKLGGKASARVDKPVVIQPGGAIQVVAPNGTVITLGNAQTATPTGSISR
jgi:hypothetical protein